MRRIEVDVQEIVRLYVEEGLRGQAIADRLGCGVGLVYARLAAAGVRTSRRARLDREDVAAAYLEGESCLSIGRRVGVSGPTVARHLRMWGVPLRTHAEALQPTGRVPCPRSRELRAYLLGFVWGDLAVHPPQGRGTTIAVAGSTTHPVQVSLVRSLFEVFGRIYVVENKGAVSLRASLDESFRYLLAKYGGEVHEWFHGWFHGWLERIGVPFVGRVIERSGVRGNGLMLNKDLHRINVNDALGLARMVATIEPFARHERRRATMNAAVQNVVDRMRARAAA
jgi:hypothetical protein